MSIRGLEIYLRNDSTSTITMGTLNIEASSSSIIWDTTNYINGASDNFEQILIGIATFNENIGNNNLVMVINSVDQSVSNAFAQFHQLQISFQEDNIKNNFSILRQEGESVLGLSGLATNNRPGLFSVDGYSTLESVNANLGNYNLPDIYTNTKEPTGFYDRTTSQISRDDSTRTFSIGPVLDSFSYLFQGNLITIDGYRSIEWPDSEGVHGFALDGDGYLITSQNDSDFEDWILSDAALVCFLYWDSFDKKSIRFLEERHGLMDPNTHWHFHNAFGAQWIRGGALIDILPNRDGSLNTHAQLGVESVTIADEDIHLTFTNNNPQKINTPAEIPIFYRANGDGYWRRKDADSFPIIYSGTAGYTGGRLAYNPDINSEGIIFVDSTTNSVTASSITLNVPVIQDDDVLIAIITHSESENNTFTTPTGWTLVVDELQVGGSPPSIPGTSVYIKVASSEPTSYNFIGTSTSSILGTMLAYRNCNTSNILDTTISTISGSASVPDPPGITTVTDGAMVIGIGFKDDGGEVITSTSPDYNERSILSIGTGGNGSSIGICDSINIVASTEIPGTFEATGNDEWAAITLALRPRIADDQNWKLVEVNEEGFVLVHYWATNDIEEPIIGILGQFQYDTIDNATVGSQTEIDLLRGLARILEPELTPLGSVIWQTSDSYTNTPKARARLTGNGGYYTDFRGNSLTGGVVGGGAPGGGGTTNHSLLSNLDANDHPQYSFDMYDAIVDVDGNGDYTSIVDAFNDGMKTIWVVGGEYEETSDIIVPNGGSLRGDGNVFINFNGNPYSVIVDPGGPVETTATSVTATNGSTLITGVGTTFTNLNPGQYIRIGQGLYEIASITSNTSLNITSNYNGRTETYDTGFWAGTPADVSLRSFNIVGSSTNGLEVTALYTGIIRDVLVSECAGDGFVLNNCNSFSITNCGVSNCSGNGVVVSRCTQGLFSGFEVINCESDGWLFDGETDTIELVGIGATSNGGDGIDITDGAFKIAITNCIIVANAARGVNIDNDTSRITLSGCLVSESGATGVDIDGNQSLIDSCVIINSSSFGIQSGANALITSNHISNNGDSGIALQAGDDNNVIVGNHIENNTNDGIEIASEGSDNSLISSNRILNNSGDGISIASANTNNNLIGNLVTGHTTNINNNDSSTVISIESAGNPNQGDIIYYNGSNWVRLAPGTVGQVLQTGGVGSNPSWVGASGGLTPPENPNEDGYVVIANNGDLTYLKGNNDGDVLTWNDGYKSWESSSGGSGGSGGGGLIESVPFALIDNDTGLNLHNTGTVGTIMIPTSNINISSCSAWIGQTATGSFICSIYNLAGTRLGASDGGGSTSSIGISKATFSTSVSLTAGTPYRIGISANANGSLFASKTEGGGNWNSIKGRWVDSNKNPSTLSSLSEATNNPWFALSE